MVQFGNSVVGQFEINLAPVPGYPSLLCIFPFNLGLIAKRMSEAAAPNPPRPLLILSIPYFDKINNLMPRGHQRIKSSGEKASLKIQELEIVLSSPIPESGVSASNRPFINQKNANAQDNGNNEAPKYFNGGLVIHMRKDT